MRVDQQTMVLIADGQRASFLRNTTKGEAIAFETLHSMGLFNEANRDIHSDKPGHTHVGMSERGTSYEQKDAHQANEVAFLRGVIQSVQTIMQAHGLTRIALIAEPRALGILRQHAPSALMQKVAMQLDKDYTKMPLPELEALLRQYEAP
jgi:protein required for attachment to host cells